MKKIKKRMSAVLCMFLCAVMVCNTIPGTASAKSKKDVMIYVTSSDVVTKFTKQNGRLVVKATQPFEKMKEKPSSQLSCHKKKISYPIAKNCQWDWYWVGGNRKSGDTSYHKIKEVIGYERKRTVENGYYDSPTAVWILVQNNKIIEVRVWTYTKDSSRFALGI